jgi:hypothetical protein
MKKKEGILQSSVLTAVFAIVFLTAKGCSADVLGMIGIGYGFPLALTEVRYDDSTGGSGYGYYSSPRLKGCLLVSIGFISTDHFGFILEAFDHKYSEALHRKSSAADVIIDSYDQSFAYLGFALEYRLFKGLQRYWNPYINVGAFISLNVFNPYDLGSPEYPQTSCLKVALGTKIRVTGPFYLNPRVSYISGSQSLLFQAGLELII